MIRYKVIWGVSLAELTAGVQDHIDQGWRPQGGVSASTPDFYMQAMVLEAA